MSFLNKLRPGAGGETPSDVQATSMAEIPKTEVTTNTVPTDTVVTDAITADEAVIDLKEAGLVPNPNAQNGVQQIEAVTLAWSKKWLAALLILYVSILPTDWFLYFGLANASIFKKHLDPFPNQWIPRLDSCYLDTFRH